MATSPSGAAVPLCCHLKSPSTSDRGHDRCIPLNEPLLEPRALCVILIQCHRPLCGRDSRQSRSTSLLVCLSCRRAGSNPDLDPVAVELDPLLCCLRQPRSPRSTGVDASASCRDKPGIPVSVELASSGLSGLWLWDSLSPALSGWGTTSSRVTCLSATRPGGPSQEVPALFPACLTCLAASYKQGHLDSPTGGGRWSGNK